MLSEINEYAMKRKEKTKKSLKLKEMLQKVQWYDVALELVGIYPSIRKKLEEYKNVFDTLLEMEPLISDEQLVIEFADNDSEYCCPFYLAFGRVSPEDEGDTMAYTPWAEWLGRDLVLDPPVWLPESRIVAVCLYEMTLYGFTEEKIKQHHLELKKYIDELVNKRKKGELPDSEDAYIPEVTMKDSLKRLGKWLRWEGIAKEYFGQEGSLFEEQFISDRACPYYDEIDRITLKAALKEIAEDILSAATAM